LFHLFELFFAIIASNQNNQETVRTRSDPPFANTVIKCDVYFNT